MSPIVTIKISYDNIGIALYKLTHTHTPIRLVGILYAAMTTEAMAEEEITAIHEDEKPRPSAQKGPQWGK